MRKIIPAVLLGFIVVFMVLVFGFSKTASSSETIPLLIMGSTLISISILGGRII